MMFRSNRLYDTLPALGVYEELGQEKPVLKGINIGL